MSKTDTCEHGVAKLVTSKYAAKNCRPCNRLYQKERRRMFGRVVQTARCEHGVAMKPGTRYAARCEECQILKRREEWAAKRAERQRAAVVMTPVHERVLCECGHLCVQHETNRDGSRGCCEVGIGGFGVNEVICPCEAFDAKRKRSAAA